MTDREALINAIADHPREDAQRLAFADWLEENGQESRGEYVRLSCRAAGLRPGTVERSDALRAADDLLAEHEADWLGDWPDRLMTWEYRRGHLWKVRMTVDNFLAHGEELFRTEPVRRLELVQPSAGFVYDHGESIAADAIRAAVRHPAFGFVREVAVVNKFGQEEIAPWLAELAAARHVTKLQSFGPSTRFQLMYEYSDRMGVDGTAVAAFCAAPHLRTLRTLRLGWCPLREGPRLNALVGHVASASFSSNLRRLSLERCGLSGAGLRRIASDPVFGRLKALNVSMNATDDPSPWAALFQSRTLTSIRAFQIGGDQLADYAGSPLAARVRDLTVTGGGRDEDDEPDYRAEWSKLIASAPPPRRLVLQCHNPGLGAFADLQRSRWLRRVHHLAIQGDSQSGVYSGSMGGVLGLFRRKAMPRLATLDLHETGSPAVFKKLAEWPGLSRLESLDAGNDYSGTLHPKEFPTPHSLTCLRDLQGVLIGDDADADALLALPGLENLTSLTLAFFGYYDRSTHRYTNKVVLTKAAVERVLRAKRWGRVTDLHVSVVYCQRLEAPVADAFAKPSVFPRLRTLRLHLTRDGSKKDIPPLDAVKARFGPRLIPW